MLTLSRPLFVLSVYKFPSPYAHRNLNSHVINIFIYYICLCHVIAYLVGEMPDKLTLFLFWNLGNLSRFTREISKILRNDLGWFIPNFPPKHVITSTNNEGFSTCYVHIFLKYVGPFQLYLFTYKFWSANYDRP